MRIQLKFTEILLTRLMRSLVNVDNTFELARVAECSSESAVTSFESQTGVYRSSLIRRPMLLTYVTL